MAQSPWLRDVLAKETDTQGVNLLFASRRGHFFVQTDQPVYNPGQRGEPWPGEERLGEALATACPCALACSPLSPMPSSVPGLCAGPENAAVQGQPPGHGGGEALCAACPPDLGAV